jgi:putative transposase
LDTGLLQRWVMRFRKCGLAGLARNDRADRRRRRSITPALKEILEALALQKPPMPIAALIGNFVAVP